MLVKIKLLDENAKLPERKSESAFCYDCYAVSREEIAPGVWQYGLGFALEMVPTPNPRMSGAMISFGFCSGQDIASVDNVFSTGILSVDLRARSSIYKTGLVLANGCGTVDEDYRGELKAIFYKVAPGTIYEVGERVCQINIGVTCPVQFEVVKELSSTKRGEGGFGTSGNL